MAPLSMEKLSISSNMQCINSGKCRGNSIKDNRVNEEPSLKMNVKKTVAIDKKQADQRVENPVHK